jgi:hypothetical protein
MTNPDAEVDRAIVDCLEGNEPMSVYQIAAVLGEPVVKIDRRCFALERRASIQHLGHGLYCAPDPDRSGGTENLIQPDPDHDNN